MDHLNDTFIVAPLLVLVTFAGVGIIATVVVIRVGWWLAKRHRR